MTLRVRAPWSTLLWLSGLTLSLVPASASYATTASSPAMAGPAPHRQTVPRPLAQAAPTSRGSADVVSPLQPQRPAALETTYAALPLRFEPNVGQTDRRVNYLARGGGYTLFLTPQEVVLTLAHRSAVPDPRPRVSASGTVIPPRPPAYPRLVAVHVRFVGANAHAAIVASGRLPGLSNYYIGRDRSAWRTGVPGYGRVLYRDIYPKVDLAYYGRAGRLEYDWIVAPGGDPRSLQFLFQGAAPVRLDQRGNLVLRTPNGTVVQQAPRAYQEERETGKAIAAHYVRLGSGRFGLAVGAYDHRWPLVIDPVLSYSTYLGGNGVERATGVTLDGSGNIYIVGITGSSNFPGTTPGTYTGQPDEFVTKMNPAGTAITYSTYVGATDSGPYPGPIAVDSTANAYIAGYTYSYGWPVRNAYQPYNPNQCQFGQCPAGYITKLDETGALNYSTYFGGNASTYLYGLTVDASGHAYVTGETMGQTYFPTTTILQSGGYSSGFLTELNTTGNGLVFSDLIGPTIGYAVAVDSSGNAYAGGSAYNGLATTAGVVQPSSGGGVDGFAIKVNSGGGSLGYSTYLGGNGLDTVYAIALDTSNNVRPFRKSCEALPTVGEDTFGRADEIRATGLVGG